MKTTKINRRSFIGGSVGIGALMAGNAMNIRSETQKRPNVIILHIDDVAYNQLGCYGGNVLTPHMDSIARDGMKFNRYYLCCSVCTPSRYSIVTGKYPSRSPNLQRQQPPGTPANVTWNTNLSPGEENTATVMRKNGYATGIVGKWHLGVPRLEQFPSHSDRWPQHPELKAKLERNYDKVRNHILETSGFDYAESIYSGNILDVPLPPRLQHHNQEWITAGALNFIDKNKDRPFYLYFNSTVPHVPDLPDPLFSLRADPRITPKGYLDEVPDVQPSRQSVLDRCKEAGMFVERDDPAFPEEKEMGTVCMTWLDDGIGAILKRLDDHGLAENTIVILASDNGVRGKNTLYDAGLRLPGAIRWPGRVPAGTEVEEFVSNIDWAVTMFDLCGITPPENMHLDGLSIAPLFINPETQLRDSVYMEQGYGRGVATKKWKYIAIRYSPKLLEQITPENRKEFHLNGSRNTIDARYWADRDYPGYFDYDQLYDLETDPGEQKNLAGNPRYSQVLNEMKDRLRNYCEKLPHSFGEFTE
ncbi:sulfatase [Candidatus Latescibacterota bacterium]